jgi:hypothetical protein
MPRPSLVTSSGPSPVRGFIAAIRAPLSHSGAHAGPWIAGRRSRVRHDGGHYPASAVIAGSAPTARRARCRPYGAGWPP